MRYRLAGFVFDPLLYEGELVVIRTFTLRMLQASQAFRSLVLLLIGNNLYPLARDKEARDLFQ